MSTAITGTRPGRTFACAACDLNYGPHDCADYRAPVTERATVRSGSRPLHEYLPYPGENDRYPAV